MKIIEMENKIENDELVCGICDDTDFTIDNNKITCINCETRFDDLMSEIDDIIKRLDDIRESLSEFLGR